jgi:hypothetical protein
MRYPEQVQNAIREAHAAGLRPSVVVNKLRAGTLPGIDRPYPEFPNSSFWHHWRRAKREQQVDGRCPTCGQLRPRAKPPEPSLLAEIHAALARREGRDDAVR